MSSIDKAMTKEEVLLYGMLLQGDIFVDGHGTTEEDETLAHQALKKMYGATDETSDEEAKAMEKQITDDLFKLVETYREKAKLFLENS